MLVVVAAIRKGEADDADKKNDCENQGNGLFHGLSSFIK
jgi:hypothetical protein